jgi:hypothetical protein
MIRRSPKVKKRTTSHYVENHVLKEENHHGLIIKAMKHKKSDASTTSLCMD